LPTNFVKCYCSLRRRHFHAIPPFQREYISNSIYPEGAHTRQPHPTTSKTSPRPSGITRTPPRALTAAGTGTGWSIARATACSRYPASGPARPRTASRIILASEFHRKVTSSGAPAATPCASIRVISRQATDPPSATRCTKPSEPPEPANGSWRASAAWL
jgi:hypothetical protein